jgi:SAM-dependent methyltransferase
MKSITHEEQQRIWDEEHRNPKVLLQMDSEEVSSGVKKFWEFLQTLSQENLKGLEMGCGKGRNVIGLAQKGIEMHGFDFSPNAIQEAKRRAEVAGASTAYFNVLDATMPWSYESDSFDFGIDCFESPEGRIFAISEFHRVLKPGAYLLSYLLSTDDEFHKEMIKISPVEERNAFLHPGTHKFEKTFDEVEVSELYKDFRVVQMERVEKTAEFFGKPYNCKHFWAVLQK